MSHANSFFLSSEQPVQPNLYPYQTIDLKTRDVLPTVTDHHSHASPHHFGGLSKPSISSSGRHFLVGTTNTQNENDMSNRLIFGILDNNNNSDNEPANEQQQQQQNGGGGGVTLCTYAVNEHVRDLEWLHGDERRIVVALNNHLGMVILNDQMTSIQNIVLFPNFHTDTIRQLCPNPSNQSLVLSGGFDGKVFVTNVSRLVDNAAASSSSSSSPHSAAAGQQMLLGGGSGGENEKKSENSVYLCGDVVGSVKWHPSDSSVASATTDNGVLHVFDIRTDQTKPAFVYGTDKIELFSHAYLDDFTVCLGYGDGSIQIHDIRIGKGLVSFKDGSQMCIGDICYNAPMKRFAVFGVPSFSAWQVNDDSTISFYGSHTSLDGALIGSPQNHWLGAHQTSGSFIPNTNRVICSDSNGILSLYDLGPPGSRPMI